MDRCLGRDAHSVPGFTAEGVERLEQCCMFRPVARQSAFWRHRADWVSVLTCVFCTGLELILVTQAMSGAPHNAANNSPTTPPALLGRRYPQELWPKLTLPPLSCFWQGFCHSNETSNYSRTQYSADSDVGAALGHDPSSSHWCFVMGSLCEHLWGQVSLLSPSLHTAMRPHDCDWLTMS